MTQEEGRDAPVCVSDERVRDTAIPLFIAVLIIFVAGFSFFRYGVSVPVTSLQVLALLPLGGVFLIFSVYAYVTSRRAEFYDGFVRIISRKGGARDVQYSQLHFELKEVRGRTGVTELGRLSVEGDKKIRMTVSDIKIEKLNTTLLRWLQAKTGTTGQLPPSAQYGNI